MFTTLASADISRSGSRARYAARRIAQLLALVPLVACSETGLFEPARSAKPFASPFGASAHATVVVTPNYSAYDLRTEFNAAGTIAHVKDFEEFTGDMVYDDLPEPWTTAGVSYTSAHNLVLSPAVPGVTSNSLATDFGAPLMGQFAAADAFTMFGADVTLYPSKVPVGLVISTNVRQYTFGNIDVPDAATGRRFVGVTLSQPGEYLTGFQFTIGGAPTAILLDNVAVGHVGSTVQNADPIASVGGPYTGPEGASISLALSATDSDNDPLTYSWNLGDGTTGTGPTPPANHVYADNGSYEITLTVSDGKGGTNTAQTTANISNVAPAVFSFSVPNAPIAIGPGGVTVPIATTFIDPGSLDTHTATLDCGAVTVQSPAPNGTTSGTCTFTSAGVYSVKLTVTDKDGDSDSEVGYGRVVVYDAAAGWVTGGGWVESAVGAYNAAATGSKLTFTVDARYTSATTITGRLDFKVSGGRLDFRSTTLDWMVISSGVARLQGRGTLNGAGDYAFEIIAVDGSSTDAVRIRVWNATTNAVVFDSKPGAATDATTSLSGGSFQIHQ